MPTSPGLAPVRTTRTVTWSPTASETSREAWRPSQTVEAATSRASSARSAATGTRQSSSRVKVPVLWEPPRVQLAKGFSVKWVEGRMRRRSSQVRMTT